MLDATTYATLPAQLRLERSHFQCMSHPDFALLSGIFMIGQSTIVNNIPTACTDGINKMYGAKFVLTLSEPEMNALVLHENGHVMLRHMQMYREMYKLDAKRANMACDYVINGWIVDTDPEGKFARLPKGGLYNAEYSNLTVKEIFDLLGKQQQPQQDEGEAADEGEGEGGGQPGEGEGTGHGGFDSHDWEGTDELTPEEVEEVGKEIEQAIREGTILVGKLKGNVNRRVTDALNPTVDWKVVLQDFISSIAQGRGSASWRQFNRRFLSKPFNMLMPHQYNETIGEVVIAVDTSGSISDDVLAGVISEMVKIVETVNPETIRILWWDACVQKEQLIKRDQSSQLVHLVESAGGGGTHMSCVSEYIIEHNIKPECVVVFTDGYVESDVNWQTTSPTVFIVDGNTSFRSPTAGGKVIFKN